MALNQMVSAAGKFLALAITAIAAPALAQPAPSHSPSASDIAAGHDLALAKCGKCHVVAVDQKDPPSILMILRPALRSNRPHGSVPSFQEVANRPGLTPDRLHQFIASTHWEKGLPADTMMPPPAVSRTEESQIILYLMSLKPPQNPPAK